jgi:hypothetical protein
MPAKAGIQAQMEDSAGPPATQFRHEGFSAQSEMLKPLAHAAFHYDAPHFLPTRFGEDP